MCVFNVRVTNVGRVCSDRCGVCCTNEHDGTYVIILGLRANNVINMPGLF